jgi:hypothetical protein
MGQMIHIVTEIFKDGSWKQVPEIPETIKDSGYKEYGLLAGVRDSFNQQIFEVKGLPEDISSLYSDFKSQRAFYTNLYYESSHSKLVYRDSEGNVIKYGDTYIQETVAEVTKEIYEAIRKNNPDPKRYYGTSMYIKGDSNEYIYSVYDASLVNATYEDVPNTVLYSTLEEYLEKCHADDWDETMQDYGYFRINFADECMGDISYLTLEELMSADYTKYNSVCYKLDKEFYNKLIENIGTLPECFSVSESGIGSLVDAMHEAIEPTITVSWLKSDEDIAKLDMHKGIEELKAIRDKYNVSSNQIRIIFGFT